MRMTRLRQCFWIALLGHLLLLLGFVHVYFFGKMQEHEPEGITLADKFVPAYVYHPETHASAAQHMVQNTQTPVSKNGIKKNESLNIPGLTPLGQLGPGNYETHFETLDSKSKKKIDQPLLKLLFLATGANLTYPKIAATFNETGTVKITYVIEPSGIVSQIHLLRTSGFEILDKAALEAIKNMSPVKGVSAYLEKPRLVQADIVFR